MINIGINQTVITWEILNKLKQYAELDADAHINMCAWRLSMGRHVQYY